MPHGAVLMRQCTAVARHATNLALEWAETCHINRLISQVISYSSHDNWRIFTALCVLHQGISWFFVFLHARSGVHILTYFCGHALAILNILK
jgi:hypothetical protein